MPNPYVGSNITGCNSPAIGADKTEYPATLDTLAERMDAHDHTTTKGLQIPTGGFADNAIITSKIVNDAVRTTNLVDGAVETDKIADSAVTTPKRAAINHVVSAFTASEGAVATSNGTVYTITNTVAITAAGTHPIRVYLANGNDNTANVDINGPAYMNFFCAFTNSIACELQLFNGATMVDRIGFGYRGGANFPLGMFKFYDTSPSVGVNTYTVKIKFPAGVGINLTTILLLQTALVAEEL